MFGGEICGRKDEKTGFDSSNRTKNVTWQLKAAAKIDDEKSFIY